MRAADIRRYGDRYVLHAWSLTTVGVWLATPPYIAVPCDCDAIKLADALREAFSGSKEGVPHPTEFKGGMKPLLDLAGKKTVRAYENSAVTASVEEDNGVLRFCPSANRGKDGHVPVDNAEFQIPVESSAETIGNAILRALDLSAKAK